MPGGLSSPAGFLSLEIEGQVADTELSGYMIQVTRLNHSRLILNSDLIEYIENTPDTVVTLINDRRITVMETAEELIDRVREYRRSLLSPEHPHIHLNNSRMSGFGRQPDGGD